MLARLSLSRTALAALMLALVPGAGWADEEMPPVKDGMPQLNPHSFASQLFWLSIFFVLVFLFLRFVGLPRVMAIIDARASKISGDIASAELLRKQAAEAETAYEATMAAAHGKARQMLAETHEQNAAALAGRTKEATAAADQQVEQAVKRIESDRAEALHGIREVALGLAAEITAKLAGRAPDAARVAPAVDHAAGEVS
jgi:F-type H+-transporting ATPase subunit b